MRILTEALPSAAPETPKSQTLWKGYAFQIVHLDNTRQPANLSVCNLSESQSADAILHILFNLNIVYDFARFQTMPGFVHQLNISGFWMCSLNNCYTSWHYYLTKNNNSVRTLKFARLRIHREAHLINLWYSWKIGAITLWDFDTNKWLPHIATLRERKCHFAIWADSSRLHNRASSCILQIQLWQCSTHRIDWTTSASFTPWARKEACVHLLRSMT